MAWRRCAVVVALLLTGLAHADPPSYGKVETFQPGKKYNCVPTSDHKAWDCNESGKASEPRAEIPPAAAPAVAAANATSESAPKASALPSYLTNSAPRGQARTVAPAPAAEQPSAPEQVAPAPAPTPAPVVAPAHAPATQAAAAEPPVATTPARVQVPSATSSGAVGS